jgi:uncharacterized RmlC-like cupin family protein
MASSSRAADRGSLRIVHAADRVPDVASGPMLREAAISQSVVGSQKIWAGYVELGPGMVSAVHHHGKAESGIYIISGRARFYAGEGLGEWRDADEGDFVWVPPYLVHAEMNASARDPVRMVVVRSTQQGLVFNLPTPDGWSPPRPE